MFFDQVVPVHWFDDEELKDYDFTESIYCFRDDLHSSMSVTPHNDDSTFHKIRIFIDQ